VWCRVRHPRSGADQSAQRVSTPRPGHRRSRPQRYPSALTPEERGDDPEDGPERDLGEVGQANRVERRSVSRVVVQCGVFLHAGQHGSGEQVEDHRDRQRNDDCLGKVAFRVLRLLGSRAHRVVPEHGRGPCRRTTEPVGEVGREVVSVDIERAYNDDGEHDAFDCIGAKAAGMRTVFVDRRGRPFGNDGYPPAAVVPDFAQLPTVLRAAQRWQALRALKVSTSGYPAVVAVNGTVGALPRAAQSPISLWPLNQQTARSQSSSKSGSLSQSRSRASS